MRGIFIKLSRPAHRPSYSTTTKSIHARWYTDIVPAMIPVALLGSAVYLGLRLAQSHLAHEKYIDETTARVRELEAEVSTLQARRKIEEGKESVVVVTPNARSWFRWT